MRHTGKLILVALCAAAVLGITVSSASANNLRTNEHGWRVLWSSLEFNLPAFGITVRCPVTLEGSFHEETIRKVLGTLIGYVTTAIVNNAGCIGGRATALTERLPWHITYEGFAGRLPEITEIKLLMVRPAFRIESAGTSCLSEPANLLGIIRGGRENGNFKPETLTPEAEEFACGLLRGRFRGSGVVTKQNREERILITLI